MDDEVTPKTPLSSKAERKARRAERKRKEKLQGSAALGRGNHEDNKEKFLNHLAKNENELLKLVVTINKLYEEKLHKDAPFMTWVLVGMQSSGKSTFMERLLNAVINIVQEGTGTRCPLDVTCIHDESCPEPRADLSGEELSNPGTSLSVEAVFKRITEHSRDLADRDAFSTASLKLVYRANNVQNMRFVDTPGIISNQSTGKDNRDEIKAILRKEISKPKTKLCVLLEATEYAKNPIINFLDESLDGRNGWISDAKFLMTKFDKQLEDSRTAIKANNFFSEFIENGIFPHLVITPTLEREDLDPSILFTKRNENLTKSIDFENSRFNTWLNQHKQFRENEGSTEVLESRIQERIGFVNAQASMNKDMLEDTLASLPEVIGSLQKDLSERHLEYHELKEKQKFTNPAELKIVVNDMLHSLQERVTSYLDGNLTAAIKYSEKLEILDEEIENEEDSLWYDKELDFHSANEESWRSKIADMDGGYPDNIQAEKRFLGGKQVHRAIEFFGAVMIDSLPDPEHLKDLVPNAVGYGGGGLMRENWEGATRQICMALMQDITHPGINYLVKHIGYILRRLFHIALDDILSGQEGSKTFRLIPATVKECLIEEFDEMLWELMKGAARNMHTALKPFYRTIDPNLPTCMAAETKDEDEDDDGEQWLDWAKSRLSAVLSGSSSEAKRVLKEQHRVQATSKKAFLRDERTSMVTKEETSLILNRSFQYLVALMEFCLVQFRLQINCYLYEEFKDEMKKTFVHKGGDIIKLVKADPNIDKRIEELEGQIEGLESSLQEVQRVGRGL